MAVCTLSRALRRLNITKKDDFPVRFITSQTESPVKVTSSLLNSVQAERLQQEVVDNHVLFSPRSVSLNFDITRNELPLRRIIECPMIPSFQIDEPVQNIIEKGDITPDTVIEAPTTSNIIEKRAERMIVIRRKKMKKHKRKKFLKRMKFVIRKREHKKKLRKDKQFQDQLQEIQKRAAEFDAKQYVAERLHLLTRERLPNKWRGVHLPEAMIRQFIKERDDKLALKRRRITYRLKLD